MIEISRALELVRQHAARLPACRVRLDQSLGLVLAEAIVSDVDSPPHDKAMVDGYAVIAADLQQGPVSLQVLEEVAAGAVPTRPLMPGRATRIMTGAPIPVGADAVVMVEQTEPEGAGGVRVTGEPSGVRAGQHILPRGTSLSRGEVVLGAGRVLRPIDVGLLAETGWAEVPVYRRPRVAVVATGSELVPVDATPGAGQIRNSNQPMLAALVEQHGGCPVVLGTVPDRREALRAAIEQGLREDVLVLSGGVSAGALDLVPQVLSEAGVQQLFHKVRLKPGKPVWFGVVPAGAAAASAGVPRLVFALPGNPVGALVSFHLFVRPALAWLAGRADAVWRAEAGVLTNGYVQRGDRPAYVPAEGAEPAVESGGSRWGPQGAGQPLRVRPVPWHGSADLRALAAADCLIYFPAGDRAHPAGEAVDVYRL